MRRAVNEEQANRSSCHGPFSCRVACGASVFAGDRDTTPGRTGVFSATVNAESAELAVGALVRVRARTYLVQDVHSAPDAAPVVDLACIDDRAQSGRCFLLVPVVAAGDESKPEKGQVIVTKMSRAIAEWARTQ